jgi:hypothetical protein
MTAMRTAPAAIRLVLAALTLLVAAYALELAVGFMPQDVSEQFQKFACNIVFLSSAGLCAARVPRPG